MVISHVTIERIANGIIGICVPAIMIIYAGNRIPVGNIEGIITITEPADAVWYFDDVFHPNAYTAAGFQRFIQQDSQYIIGIAADIIVYRGTVGGHQLYLDPAGRKAVWIRSFFFV